MALTMERAGGEHGLDRCGQRGIRQRAHRSTPSRCRGRQRAVAVNAGAGDVPGTADRRQPIGFAGYQRSNLAHGLNVRRDKGRLASSTAIFSCSRSRSISAAPSLAFSRSLSSSSPVADFVARAASPAARNASRQPLSVAAVTPRLRETVSRSSPPAATATPLRLSLPRHPATPAGQRCAGLLRSLRVARPHFNVLLLLLVHMTPLRRKSSAYEVSQSTV